ncbi:MAG: HD domain-containing protein [Deltaproteobacteria bacterium]|nr:HD domain-containing protein [Deltaproteobacteria bacterium]
MTPKTSKDLLYNSRIIDTYIKWLKKHHPDIDTGLALEYANMQGYEVADQSHWFTQMQIDRFYEKAVLLTGNTQIAREAGRYSASPEAIGAMRQYILGLVGPAHAFNLIRNASSKFTRSSQYQSRRLSDNSVEVLVTPNPGIEEKPFQCENRMGFFEAVCMMFNDNIPVIDHSECLFKGDRYCRYVISWKPSAADLWGKSRDISAFALTGACGAAAFWNPILTAQTLLPASVAVVAALAYKARTKENLELRRSLDNLFDSSDKLIEQMNINYSNSLMHNEIGQAISAPTEVDEILANVILVLENRLDFDRGMIMLANKEHDQLLFRTGFGYTSNQLQMLNSVAFHLDKPSSRGVFVVAFHEQRPFLIDDVQNLAGKLSQRSYSLIEKLGARSFICCPIICEGKSIGVLAVDNLKSKRQLQQSDVSLLMGIAPMLGISIRNADLLLTKERQFHSTLEVLAATIDARDPLTAGHSKMVTEYAVGICNTLNVSEEETERIRVAALLHDYGKIGVPDAILKKKGRLTEEEYEVVKTHASQTQSILEGIHFEGIYHNIPAIAAAHHESIDGSGYPLGLKGDDIPLGSLIIAVADFFEAITSMRHYRDPMPVGIAYKVLRQHSGTRFDSQIVEGFIRYHQKQQDPLHNIDPGPPLRVPLRTDVSLRTHSHATKGLSEDLSKSGMFVSVPEPVKEGALIKLHFSLPGVDSPPIEALAQVVWTNNSGNKAKPNFPTGNGLLFTEMEKPAEETLHNFIEQVESGILH